MIDPTRGLRTADFDFVLPPELIAQTPVADRDASRLLIVERATGRISHGSFRDLPSIIPAGDTVVVNRSRVLKARLLGTREGGGQAEVLLLQPREDGRWEALVRPSARMKPGHRMRIAPDVHVVIEDATDDGTRVVRLDAPMSVDDVLERYGHIPLPPYITRGDEASDAERYQTVYAAEAGSVAAPTAGLHFTPQIIETLRTRGVGWETVLLHVGAGTFKPVDVEDPADHVMHHERYTLSPETATALTATRARGGALWAVGTTSLRVLESTVDASGAFQARGGSTDIFIRPPYTMRGADHLITNFHLPKSTLLMLVAAVAGYELTMDAYATAVAAGYRFYSYGDAMCIV